MIWVGLGWLLAIGLLVLAGLAFAGSIPLMRRRVPDPPDEPARHGLPGEAVRFPSRDGLMLGGWWIPADGPSRGAIILCAGQNGSADADLPQAIPLHTAGFDVLLFDWRAHGRSEGTQVTMGAREQLDLAGAIDYATGERGADRIGVLGFSMGAGVALMTAATDARIATLVLDGAYPRLDGILAARLRLAGLPGPPALFGARLILLAASLRANCQLFRANPIDYAPGVQAPALFIHGEADPFVSGAELDALQAALGGPSEAWRVAGAGHRQAVALAPDEYARRVVAWFETQLGAKAG